MVPKTAEELDREGLQVLDLKDGSVLAGRRLHSRNDGMQMTELERLSRVFVEQPEAILEELVNAAVQLCGADSAGVSIEREEATNEHYYTWVATAGEYSGFLDAALPKHPSACTVCLERGGPQLFRADRRFFDALGVTSAEVTDGLMLPWTVEEMRGTLFVIAHGRTEAFDAEDLRLMQVMASFAAMGIRQQRQQQRLMEQARVEAAVAMAHELAHEINNPLQSLTNLLYLARTDGDGERSLALKLEGDFQRLSMLVKSLLELPRASSMAEVCGGGVSVGSLPVLR